MAHETTSQSSIDGLHTTTLNARSSTMQIYWRQMNTPSQSSMDALYKTTSTTISSTMHIYWRQMKPFLVNQA